MMESIKERMKEKIKQSMNYILAGGLILIALVASRNNYAQSVQMSLAEKVLRFHVIAQSDSQEDQNIKLKVRDAVVQFTEGLLADSDSLEETIGIIQAHLKDIENVANDVLEAEGVDYRATASLTHMEFPEKEYSGFVFPEGEYQALRIVLGEGNGQNWWCVMYPNLCFSGNLFQTDEKELKIFKRVLSPRECEAIMDGKDYTIRFKLIEYIRKILYN